MEIRGKTNTKFCNKAREILARQESSFNQVHARLQSILTELQALKSFNTRTPVSEAKINPFSTGDIAHTSNADNMETIPFTPRKSSHRPNPSRCNLVCTFNNIDAEYKSCFRQLICVNMQENGLDSVPMLDTGESSNVMSAKEASRLGLHLSASTWLVECCKQRNHASFGHCKSNSSDAVLVEPSEHYGASMCPKS